MSKCYLCGEEIVSHVVTFDGPTGYRHAKCPAVEPRPDQWKQEYDAPQSWTERSRERYEEYLRKYWAPTGLLKTCPPLTRETMDQMYEIVKESHERRRDSN